MVIRSGSVGAAVAAAVALLAAGCAGSNDGPTYYAAGSAPVGVSAVPEARITTAAASPVSAEISSGTDDRTGDARLAAETSEGAGASPTASAGDGARLGGDERSSSRDGAAPSSRAEGGLTPGSQDAYALDSTGTSSTIESPNVGVDAHVGISNADINATADPGSGGHRQEARDAESGAIHR